MSATAVRRNPAEAVLRTRLGALRLEDISAFVVTTEELEIERAAARLFVSPAALAQRLRGLELAVGGELLARTAPTVRLTPLGLRFLQCAIVLTTSVAGFAPS